MKKFLSMLFVLALAFSVCLIPLTANAESGDIYADDSGVLHFDNVEDNMGWNTDDSATAYYPQMIYKQKLTGQYSVQFNVSKLNNGGVDWLFGLGLDSPTEGGYAINSEAMGFSVNGSGVLAHDRPEDSTVYITIYKVDEQGNKTDEYATGTCVKDAIGGWADGNDLSYKFEVREDGMVNLYYDVMGTPNACTTLRNIVVFEGDNYENLNEDFSLTDGYFGFMPNNNRAFTSGVAGYDPLNLKAYSYEIKYGETTDSSNFTNFEEKWNLITEAPMYTISVEGGVANVTSAAAGATVTLTAQPPEGKELDYWTVNGEKIEGNSFTMPAENVTAEAVFKDATGQTNPGGDQDEKPEEPEGGCNSAVGASAAVIGAVALAGAAAALISRKKKNTK